ncbi:MAG: hypothetical protein PHT99_07435, partial [Methanoregula sp.]|nr:hypothetical protein [Methanoregula sp.]
MKQPTRTGTAFYSPEQAESFVSLLVGLCMSRNTATVVVFLDHVPGSTYREIIAATGMRRGSVEGAILTLEAMGWVGHRKVHHGHNLVKVFSNILSIEDITYLLRKAQDARDVPAPGNTGDPARHRLPVGSG